MPDLGIFGNYAPYHILFYGTALGSSIFQSFVGGIVAFKALPRAQFSTLQQKIFPVYFAMQTFLPALAALTYPGASTPSSLRGVLDPSNRLSVLVPLATAFVTSLANLVYIGPATTRVLRLRKHQETRDGKRCWDPEPHSEAMRGLNRQFGMLHGLSSLTGLVGVFALVGYGFTLGSRL